MTATIISNDQQLEEILIGLRAEGKSIVLTQGSFDLIHIGHARYCQKAKSFADVLFIGVDNDEKIKQRKGPERPIVPENERLEMMSFLRPVDYVVLKKADAPKWHLIKQIRPDVLIATRETYNDEQLKALEEWCKKVVVLEPMATTSTSAKIRRMQIGTANRIEATLRRKIIGTIEEVLGELKK